MNKIRSVTEFLDSTLSFPETVFFRGENRDYCETACVAKAIRDASSYDMYPHRIDMFDRKVRENALLDKPETLVPYAQHSGLATKLLDITSSPLVALYFACQPTEDNSDGCVYVFDDYADATDMLEAYPRFDLEEELLKHLEMLREQKRHPTSKMLSEQNEQAHEQEYTSVEHDELYMFGKCIERYRQKYLFGGYSKHLIGRGISAEDSTFVGKREKLDSLLHEIKSRAIEIASRDSGMSAMLLPQGYTEKTSAVDFLHPYKSKLIGCYDEKRYVYYRNEQYKAFDLEVREYLISLECLVAFINDVSPLGNLASMVQLDSLTMDFLPNLLYRPIFTFKRGLSQQSAFFVQTLFDKHGMNVIDDVETMELQKTLPRQLLKRQANYDQKIIIDNDSKQTILGELNKIDINRATMFGDADSIAAYIMDPPKIKQTVEA